MTEPAETVSRINVFVGYQIDSAYHTKEEIQELMDALSDRLKARFDINLDVNYGVFEPGSNIWDEVREKIAESQIAIFDISENNPNVLVEVGLAYGMGKHVIMLKNKKSRENYERPSDLMPLIYQPYPHGELNNEQTVDGIISSIHSFIRDRHTEEFYFRQIWGFEQTEPILVACSELPYAVQWREPESNEFFYLGNFGDVDSLLETVITLNCLYPKTNVEFKPESGVNPEDLQKNIIIVGGPDYNQYASRFGNKIPFIYETGESSHDIYLKHQETGNTFEPDISNEPIVDYGFFAKTENPYNPEKSLIFIGGCHTYGVYGAAKAFGYHSDEPDQIAYNNCQKIVDKYGTDPTFCTILEVEEITGEGVVTPRVKDDSCEQLTGDENYVG